MGYNDVAAPTGNHSEEDDPSQKQQLEELKARDREVKTHEMAHVAAGASSPTYDYETGPDGRQYAVGGTADIDTSSEGDPRSDLEKSRQIRRAALAPANPSQQDLQVATYAKTMEADALQKMQKESRDEGTDSGTMRSEGLGQPAVGQYVQMQTIPIVQVTQIPVQNDPTTAIRSVESASGYDRNGRPTRTQGSLLSVWA
jgi:hypothetical protein